MQNLFGNSNQRNQTQIPTWLSSGTLSGNNKKKHWWYGTKSVRFEHWDAELFFEIQNILYWAWFEVRITSSDRTRQQPACILWWQRIRFWNQSRLGIQKKVERSQCCSHTYSSLLSSRVLSVRARARTSTASHCGTHTRTHALCVAHKHTQTTLAGSKTRRYTQIHTDAHRLTQRRIKTCAHHVNNVWRKTKNKLSSPLFLRCALLECVCVCMYVCPHPSSLRPFHCVYSSLWQWQMCVSLFHPLSVLFLFFFGSKNPTSSP